MTTPDHVDVSALLPYPLRLTGGPFEVNTAAGSVRLSIETVRNGTPDERVHGGGDFDFKIDRSGWASYSKVTAEIPASHQAVAAQVFLSALNTLIEHLRDIGHPWMRPLEEADLFQLNVSRAGEGSIRISMGRTGAITPPVIGLTEAATEDIQQRLQENKAVALWRTMELDASDAIDTGRYEEGLVLAWTALESAARGELPELARSKGITPADLWEKLVGNRRRVDPLSTEDAVERSRANIFALLAVFSDLLDSGYESHYLSESVRGAYQMRNAVAHEGIRVSSTDAKRSLEAIQFVLRAWNLPTTKEQRPFDTAGWIAHYGQISSQLEQSLARNEGAFILMSPQEPQDPLWCPFDVVRWNNRFRVYVPHDTPEPIAATLLIATSLAYNIDTMDAPQLVYDRGAPRFFSSASLSQITTNINRAISIAYFLLHFDRNGLSARDAANYMIRSWRYSFAQLDHTFDRADIRFAPIAARFAAFLYHAEETVRAEFRAKLSRKHRPLIDRSFEIEALLRKHLRQDTPHSVCDFLREFHVSQMWLDTIRVLCPIESKVYGSREWSMADWIDSQRR